MRTIKYVIFVFLVFALFSCEKQEFTNLADSDLDFPAPTNIEVSQNTVTSCTLIWEDNSVGEVGFQIDRKRKGEEWIPGYRRVEEDVETWIDTTMVAGSQYYYRVYGFAGENRSTSLETEIELSFSGPTYLNTVINSVSSCTLDWDDNSEGESGFKIDRKKDDEEWFEEYITVGENVVTFTDSELQAGSIYYYRVYGYAGVISTSSFENQAELTYVAPDEFNISLLSFTSCNLSWIYENLGDEEGFKIFRRFPEEEWNEIVQLGNSIRDFTDFDLNSGENYEYKIFAYNTLLEAGEEVTTVVKLPPTDFTDVDGNLYSIVQIGTQFWMRENLAVTHYRNGEAINFVDSPHTWKYTNEGSCCVLYNVPGYLGDYGLLYNYLAIQDDRGFTPEGWKLPSDEEFKEMEIYLGMSVEESNDFGFRGYNIGSKLAGNESLWEDTDIVNSSEFGVSGLNLVPGGYRDDTGAYYYMDKFSRVWTSTFEENYGDYQILYRRLEGYETRVRREYTNETYGLSVRCIWGE